MKKNFGGKVVKRAMAVALAVALSAGSVLPAMAVEEPSYVQDDNYVNPDAAKFNNVETVIDPQIIQNVQQAQAAAQDAQLAADAAQIQANEAQKQAKEAEDQAGVAATQAKVANGASEDAADAANDALDTAGENPNYTYTTDANGNVIGYAPTDPSAGASAIPSSQEDSIDESAWEEVSELKDIVQDTQAGRDNWQAGMEGTMQNQKDSIDASVQDAQDAAAKAEAARILAEAAAVKAQTTTDINVAKAAQVEVQQAANTAASEAKNATDSYEEALAKLVAAQQYYDNMKAFDASANSYENGVIDDKKDSIEAISIVSYESELAAAEVAYLAALGNAQKAATAAETAADASEDASVLAGQFADTAEDKADLSTDKADAAIDHDVDPAQAALDAAKKVVEDQLNKVKELEATKLNAQSSYNGIVNSVTAQATAQYNTELEKRAQAVRDAEAKLNSISDKWYNVIKRAKAKEALEDAKSDFNSYNNGNTKTNLINSALVNTSQYKAVQTATANVDTGKKILSTNEATAAQKAKVLADAEAVKAAYLADIQKAQEEAQKNVIVNALKLTIGTSSDNINQTQYDAELSEWANKFWNGWIWEESSKDAKKVRADFQIKYNESSEFRKFVEKYSIIQWTSDNTEKLISAVEQAYKAELKQQEEKLATVNAYIAKTDAAGSADDAVKAAKSAKIAADAAKIAENAAKVSADLKLAQSKLDTAKETFAKAQASLKAAKDAASNMNATYVSFDKTMEILKAAQEAVDKAKTAKEKAEKDAALALAAKNKVDSIIANWKYADNYVQENTPATVTTLPAVTAPAQLPTVQVTAIDEAPVALTAQPTTTRRVRTVATTDATEIEEEATPEVAQPEVVQEADTAKVDADTTEIEEEDTALASTMQEDGFAWWWILILIAVVTGGGFAGYRYYKGKKVVEE